jgi:G:T/U-mismatch repair DNA glycosylase
LWWKILPQIYGAAALPLTKDRDAPEVRASVMRHFLAGHGMWMRDVLQTFHREVPESAKDSDLRHHSFTDFGAVFEQCPTIDTVVFTGQKAEEWTYRAMREQGLIPEGLIKRTNGENIPRYRRILVSLPSGAREIDFHTLPSPSDGNFFTYTDEEKQEWYGKVLLHRCRCAD